MGRALWYQEILDENLRLRFENDAVKEENRLLKARIAYLEKRIGKDVRDAREAPFEENTPSSKQNFKKDSPEERRARQGGARPGHEGHGRSIGISILPAKTPKTKSNSASNPLSM